MKIEVTGHSLTYVGQLLQIENKGLIVNCYASATDRGKRYSGKYCFKRYTYQETVKLQQIRYELVPDRNSGAVRYRFRWILGWFRSGRFYRYRNFFPCWIIGFLCFALMFCITCPLQFPSCITCSPPVPRLYHVLPFSS